MRAMLFPISEEVNPAPVAVRMLLLAVVVATALPEVSIFPSALAPNASTLNVVTAALALAAWCPVGRSDESRIGTEAVAFVGEPALSTQSGNPPLIAFALVATVAQLAVKLFTLPLGRLRTLSTLHIVDPSASVRTSL